MPFELVISKTYCSPFSTQAWTGTEAKEIGLVDELGGVRASPLIFWLRCIAFRLIERLTGYIFSSPAP
jgi:hypothetical protein